MLGKRFRRTTSMSYIGPKAPLPAGGEPSTGGKPAFSLPHQASASPTTSICAKSPGPLLVDVQHQWHIAPEKALQDEAMATSMDVHMSPGAPVPHLIHHHPDVHVPYSVETEPVGPNLQGLGFSENLKIGQYIPPHMLAAHESIWGQYVASVPAQIHRIEAAESISPVDFLDVCFFCKKRLRHERDIFIYRGDTAFCSEECRHRQIANDERRSKKGTATTETAVAA